MTWEILLNILQPQMLLVVFLGVLFGVVMGAIPGLSGTIGIALLLPMTFKMPPDAAILMLGGIFMGGMYGGSITAILINVPGDVAATCTAFEGYPLAKQGRSREALFYSAFSSMFGGIIGVLALIFFTPMLANIALRFGPPEMFLLSFCGLVVVGSLSGKNMFKSFMAVVLGLLIATIGVDPMTGYDRFTFGFTSVKTGISTVPLAIGLFCFSQMFQNVGQRDIETIYYKEEYITRWNVVKDIITKWKLLIKSSFIGTLIGILPGVGSTMAVFLSYGEAKRTDKSGIPFGTGNVNGIIAAESANNALVGGAMVPMLALGIPGSATAAIIGSTLYIHGLVPGPELFTKSPHVAYTFLYGMLLTVVAMIIIGAYGVKYFSYIQKVKMYYMLPTVLVCAMFGVYCLNNSLFEVKAAIFLGILGAIFKLMEIPCAPVVVGIIISPLMELNLRRSLILAKAAGTPIILYMIQRPLCIILFVLVAVLLYLFFSMSDARKNMAENEE